MSLDNLQPASPQREENSIRMYLRDIHRYELLSPQQEQKLARAARRGDKEAREKMIQSNLRLVVSIAKQFLNRGIPFTDLIEEGNIGLIIAVKKFDPRKHFKFSTYATWWIKQRIKRAIQEAAKTNRVPPGLVKLVTDYRTSYAELERKYGRSPTTHEMARELRLPPSHIQTLKRTMRTLEIEPNTVPRTTEGSSPEDISDESYISPEKSLLSSSEAEMLRKLLRALNDREAQVLRMRFGIGTGEPSTLVDVGHSLGITRERVRQIEKEALFKLRRILRKHPDYSKEITSFPATALIPQKKRRAIGKPKKKALQRAKKPKRKTPKPTIRKAKIKSSRKSAKKATKRRSSSSISAKPASRNS